MLTHHWRPVICLAIAAVLPAGCGANSSASAGGHGGGAGGAVGGATAPGPGGAGGASSCDPAPTPLRRAGTILELPIDPVYEGRPFVYGEPNMLSADSVVTPLDLRFYLSAVELLTAAGESIPVDIVTTSGAVQPYDVFLFNSEDAGAQTLRLLAPPGSYAGLKVAVGISPACNAGGPVGRVFPLSDGSEMTWPHLAGYLFFRYESRTSTGVPGATTTPAGVPLVVHMGADIRNLAVPSALVFRVPGSISIPAAGSVSRHLRLAMDQVLKGAASQVDVSDFPALLGEEAVAGERLRRSGASLPLFELAP